MDRHSEPTHSLLHEESATLLDLEEKFLSDIESDAGRTDMESRFPCTTKTTPLSKRLKLKATWQALSRIGIFLLPSFIQSRFFPPSIDHKFPQKKSAKTGPTTYLDGMRGLAAFVVFLCHYFYTCFIIAQSYGYGSSNYHILKLPIIRLFYQGPPMVAIFFVISGYALSLKPLKLIRSKSYDNLLSTISSMIFRRGVRLFLPTFISTLFIIFWIRIGAYEWTRDFAYDDIYMRNVQEIHYERLNSTSEQLADWGKEMFRFVHIWDWDAYEGSTAIDVHLWTIPVEFRASMMLFLMLLGTARLKTVWRFVVLGLVGAFVYRSGRWEVLLFLGGMLLAEVDLVRGVHEPTSQSRDQEMRGSGLAMDRLELGGSSLSLGSEMDGETVTGSDSEGSSTREGSMEVLFDHDHDIEKLSSRATSKRPLRTLRPLLVKTFWILLSILALYLMSQPDQGGEETPGWITLTSLIPKWWYAPTKQQHVYQQLDSFLSANSTSPSHPPSHSATSSSDDDIQFGQGTPAYRYYQSIGAPLFFLATTRLPFLWQRIFNSPPIQYLGKISYAIYLMHGPVLHTIGYSIERFVWTNITGVETDFSYVAGFGLASLVIIPIVVWVSDVFWRAVDEPVVWFGKWLEGRCSVTSTSTTTSTNIGTGTGSARSSTTRLV